MALGEGCGPGGGGRCPLRTRRSLSSSRRAPRSARHGRARAGSRRVARGSAGQSRCVPYRRAPPASGQDSLVHRRHRRRKRGIGVTLRTPNAKGRAFRQTSGAAPLPNSSGRPPSGRGRSSSHARAPLLNRLKVELCEGYRSAGYAHLRICHNIRVCAELHTVLFEQIKGLFSASDSGDYAGTRPLPSPLACRVRAPPVSYSDGIADAHQG